MLFNSPQFIFLFLPIVVVLYYLLKPLKQGQLAQIFLVCASLFFYAWWNPIYLPILITSVLVNFYIGRALIKARSRKRLILITGIVFNLGLLGWFKYSDFFISNINQLLDSRIHLLNLVLPLAISFFTFQQIAYLVDSYQGKVKEHKLLNYSLFVTFFPQLIAGPIVHHKEMMPQFDSSQSSLDWNRFASGIFIFSLGLFKKTIIADTFAIWANAGFNDPGTLTFVTAWGASLSYTFQLYYDFSAYTDMAIGAALLFNISLPVNFNSPYKAINIQDFWRRWHITLSRWLRDYLYIPLGGNRRSQVRTYFNLFITFLLGGLWHGAGWTFLVWGSLHGIAMLVQRLWAGLNIQLPRFLAWLITFLFVNIAWVYFRANNIADANLVLAKMSKPDVASVARQWNHLLSSDFGASLITALEKGDIFLVPGAIMVFGLVFALLAFVGINTVQMIGFVAYKGRWYFRVGIVSGMITALLLFIALLTFVGQVEPGEFIYFNF